LDEPSRQHGPLSPAGRVQAAEEGTKGAATVSSQVPAATSVEQKPQGPQMQAFPRR
jgi:hypothetical protein